MHLVKKAFRDLPANADFKFISVPKSQCRKMGETIGGTNYQDMTVDHRKHGNHFFCPPDTEVHHIVRDKPKKKKKR